MVKAKIVRSGSSVSSSVSKISHTQYRTQDNRLRRWNVTRKMLTATVKLFLIISQENFTINGDHCDCPNKLNFSLGLFFGRYFLFQLANGTFPNIWSLWITCSQFSFIDILDAIYRTQNNRLRQWNVSMQDVDCFYISVFNRCCIFWLILNNRIIEM